MSITDSILAEVNVRANNNLEQVLSALMKNLSDPAACAKATALASYVAVKLVLHRCKKRHRIGWNCGGKNCQLDCGMDWDDSCIGTCSKGYESKSAYINSVSRLITLAEEKRKEYYESSCWCSSCRSC